MKLLFFYSFLLLISGCSSGSEEQKTTKELPKQEEKQVFESFPAGQIIERVNCKSDTSQNYTLYLPKAYDAKKTYPVIYAFDPHKTGKLPVANYKELAEKYGYVIIGSNNSENGLTWEQSQSIASVLFNDTKNRISINNNRIYLLGFSGGARVANALTMINSSINGVICCGAASPASNVTEPRNNYSFFGIAGNADMNYSEMKKYDMLDLAPRNMKHIFISFDGKHEWPPETIMEEAFLWLELDNIRKDPSAKNDSLIAQSISEESKKLEILLQKKKNYEAYELCRKVINYYERLGDLSPFFTAYNNLKTNPEVDKQLKQDETELAKEENLKGEYMNHLQTKDLDWWQKDIASLNSQIKTGKDKNETLIRKRLLSYLSLVCYMQTSSALKQNEQNAAEHFGKLYVLVDPTNTEAHYFMAVINAKNGNAQAAIKSLEAAIKNGFKDLKRIENDAAFATIKTSEEFKKALQKIK
jgi:hypothetical protein